MTDKKQVKGLLDYISLKPGEEADFATNSKDYVFGMGIGAIIYISFKLGKDRGTMLASARAVDTMIAMGYLKEKPNGEIEKVENDK